METISDMFEQLEVFREEEEYFIFESEENISSNFDVMELISSSFDDNETDSIDELFEYDSKEIILKGI